MLATELVTRFDTPGRYVISAGPPERAQTIVFQTYAVSIETEDGGPIPENVPVTLVAHTDPPGHENEVTWLAATRDGSVGPAFGRGATFTTTFANPWTPVPGTSLYSEWVGVRADNALITQDPQDSKFCIYKVTGIVGTTSACPAWVALDARCKGPACTGAADCSNSFEHQYVSGANKCCVVFTLVECTATSLTQACPGVAACTP